MINLSAKARAFINENMGLLTEAQKSYVPENARTAAPDWADMVCLEQAGIFDGDDYFSRYPEALKTGKNALEHYLTHGIIEGKQLNLLPENKGSKTIIRQGGLNDFYSMPLTVIWNITNMCNYHCSYCFGPEKLDKNKFSTREELLKAVDNLYTLNRTTYSIGITGGEPTTHPYLLDMIKYAGNKFGNKLDFITLFSNGSRNKNFYECLPEIAKSVNLNLFISLHSEHLQVEHIMELIETLSGHISLNFNFMYNPKKREFCRNLFAILLEMRKKYSFTLSNVLVREGINLEYISKEYTDDDFKWREWAIAKYNDILKEYKNFTLWKRRFKENKDKFWDYYIYNQRIYEKTYNYDKSKMFKNGFFHFKNMYCCLGTSVISIGSDGYVKGAECPAVAKKYNIFRENLFLKDDFIAPFKCPLENCSCGGNETIPKFVYYDEAKEFCKIYKYKIR